MAAYFRGKLRRLVAGFLLASERSFVRLQIAAQAGVPEHRAGLAAGLISTSQELGGALGVAVSASWAFRRVDELTSHVHGDPRLVEAARTTVFHDGFAAGAVFALAALLICLVRLPESPMPTNPSPPETGASAMTTNSSTAVATTSSSPERFH